ncbi:MAG: cytochrome c [Chloroflexi bacterium]|nr:cytochrome c [Chloroflexota bacterium]
MVRKLMVGLSVAAVLGLAACGGSSGGSGSVLKYPGGGNASAGKTLFLGAGGCSACHTVAGTSAAGQIGPNLSHVGSALTPDQIYTQIADPKQRPAPYATPPRQGAAMPQNSLTTQQRADLTAWLSTLK